MWKRSVCTILAITLAVAGERLVRTSAIRAAGEPIPVAQQNALIAQYCGVCHDDAHRNGGLSLQGFDAANPDPGVVVMLISKLKTGALGAAGLKPPDQATTDALIGALSAKTAGAHNWSVHRTQDAATRAPVLTASMVQEVPSTIPNAPVPDFYQLTLTCRLDTRKGAMQLAWSPAVPENGRVLSVAADGKAAVAYKVEGTEKMGNGASGNSGPGAILLSTTKKGAAAPHLDVLPVQNLTVSNAFPNETVVFPFGGLDASVRESLAACFPASR
jgi:hypothetical protein